MNILSTILGIGALILGIIVLVRLFQRKGVLHGLLGILTCGIYPFIWGWIKAREENLTVIMIAWTALQLLEIALIYMTYTIAPNSVG